jgi:hypothetical protein
VHVRSTGKRERRERGRERERLTTRAAPDRAPEATAAATGAWTMRTDAALRWTRSAETMAWRSDEACAKPSTRTKRRPDGGERRWDVRWWERRRAREEEVAFGGSEAEREMCLGEPSPTKPSCRMGEKRRQGRGRYEGLGGSR